MQGGFAAVVQGIECTFPKRLIQVRVLAAVPNYQQKYMPFENRDNEAFAESIQVGFLKANYQQKVFELWQKDSPPKVVGNTLAQFEVSGIRSDIGENGADRWHVFIFDLKDGDDQYQIKFSRDQFTCYLLLKQALSVKPGEKVDFSFHSKGISLTRDGKQIRYHPQSMEAPGPEKVMGEWVWGKDVVDWMINAANFINTRIGNDYSKIENQELGNAIAPQESGVRGEATAGLPQEDHRVSDPFSGSDDDLPF